MSSRTLWSMVVLPCLMAIACSAAEPQKPAKDSKAVSTSVKEAKRESEEKKGEHKKEEQPSRITSTVDVKPVGQLNDRESNEVSFAAGRILKHIAQARDAISENNKDEAANHVEQGLKLIAIIDTVLPHLQVKTQIKSGEVVYTDEDDVTATYVTLFNELERRDIIAPVVLAKKEAEQKQGQPKNASDSAEKAAPAAPAVMDEDIVYSVAKLNLAFARRLLNLAKKELHDGKIADADAALLAVQAGGVLLESVEVDLPLRAVADNLKLAENEMKDGRHAEAKAALNVAIDELKQIRKERRRETWSGSKGSVPGDRKTHFRTWQGQAL